MDRRPDLAQNISGRPTAGAIWPRDSVPEPTHLIVSSRSIRAVDERTAGRGAEDRPANQCTGCCSPFVSLRQGDRTHVLRVDSGGARLTTGFLSGTAQAFQGAEHGQLTLDYSTEETEFTRLGPVDSGQAGWSGAALIIIFSDSSITISAELDCWKT